MFFHPIFVIMQNVFESKSHWIWAPKGSSDIVFCNVYVFVFCCRFFVNNVSLKPFVSNCLNSEVILKLEKALSFLEKQVSQFVMPLN